MRHHTIIALSLFALPSAAQGGLPINVEIDYMEVPGDHSHKPQPEEIAAVVQMFACHGITLNIVVDDAINEIDIMRCPLPGISNFWTCGGPTSYASIKSANFDNGPLGWHYCVFGHQYDNGKGTNSSGLADTGGVDFIVTLGSFDEQIGTPWDRAATFAHELGHNLGLRHWSPTTINSSGNYAPNYASIMSYQYQLEGVASQLRCLGLIGDIHKFKELDYSNGRLPRLAEWAMGELDGVGIHSVDWNCNGTISGTQSENLDLDEPWCGAGNGDSDLGDWNDWANLIDSSYFLPLLGTERVYDTVSCITSDEARAIRARRPTSGRSGAGHVQDPNACNGSQPTLGTESCQTGEMVFVSPTVPGSQNGTGSAPYFGVNVAHDLAPSGSILYLQPGTHVAVNATSILMTKPLILSGPGSAVIDP